MMENRAKKILCLLLPVVFVLLAFFGCGQSAEALSPEESEIISDLGDMFVDDLQNDILPLKDAPEVLPSLGYVLVDDDVTHGADTLYEAYGKYRMGEDSRVTIVFSNKSYVATHIVFSGGKGYYFRYEYDQFHPDEIAVSGRAIDDMKLDITEKPPKVELQILKNKREVVRLSLRNPTEMAEGNSE